MLIADAERIAAILTATTTYSSGNASINACRAVARLADTEPFAHVHPWAKDLLFWLEQRKFTDKRRD